MTPSVHDDLLPVTAEDMLAATGVTLPPHLAIRILDPRLDALSIAAPGRMRVAKGDPISPAALALDEADERNITIGIGPAGDPGRLHTMMTVEINVFGRQEREMEIFVDAVFTDARERGRGYATLLAAALATLVARRWDADPVGEATAVADPRSEGGRRAVARLGAILAETLARHREPAGAGMEPAF
ncbi:hypothetical protein [Defluviimonas salinarum]|uniref:N-acetyltransferase domain-containing protein n=1 Tax=Defluviimonas salinarum TaxID=2992147 RepID=A0ABT3J5T2_9RHOB|nr:hypothetical protein [Defluviimonas salinarum]MCW3783015.1 hypothetical protein [Defluviimonas salinarum]